MLFDTMHLMGNDLYILIQRRPVTLLSKDALRFRRAAFPGEASFGSARTGAIYTGAERVNVDEFT
jgi:hypothetical protein